MMKYIAIIRYFNGMTLGYTVAAKDAAEAWDKLYAALPFDNVQTVELAEVLTPGAEIE